MKTTQRRDVSLSVALVSLDGEGDGDEVAVGELSIVCSHALSVASDSGVSEK